MELISQYGPAAVYLPQVVQDLSGRLRERPVVFAIGGTVGYFIKKEGKLLPRIWVQTLPPFRIYFNATTVPAIIWNDVLNNVPKEYKWFYMNTYFPYNVIDNSKVWDTTFGKVRILTDITDG